MKLRMIALISSVLGAATAIGVHHVGTHVLAHHRADHNQAVKEMEDFYFGKAPSPIEKRIDPFQAYPATDRGPMNPDRPIWGPEAPPTKDTPVLMLVKTSETTTAKDPIWQLRLVKGKTVLSTLSAVTGRASRQNFDRHAGGNKSPLPQGTYVIDRKAIVREKFSDPELGNGYWVPIYPTFPTGRSALGFHHDPSWGKKNGESGTSGCIGLRTPEDTLTLVEWIKHFNVHKLIVSS